MLGTSSIGDSSIGATSETPVSSDLTFSYAILAGGLVSADLTFSYKILGSVRADLQLVYAILGSAPAATTPSQSHTVKFGGSSWKVVFPGSSHLVRF